MAPWFDVVSGQRKSGAKVAAVAPQLTLLMGLAIQSLPKEPEVWPRVGAGLHFQLSPIDLGQFVAYDDDGKVSEPSRGSAFTVGAQAGLLLGTPRDGFVLGVDARYSPTLFAPNGDVGKGAGAVRVGVFAAYYVPLFDFN